MGAKQLVMNLGSFLTNKLALVEASAVEHLVKDISHFYVSSVAGICNIVAERDEANEGDEELRTVVPHQLATISHAQFCTIIQLTGNAWQWPGGH